jgi:hypothetical protein
MHGMEDGAPTVRRRARLADPLALTALTLLGLVAHRPAAMLRAPFWIDEAWVADSVRVPLGSLRSITSSTPIGWTFLLRLVPPVGGPERLRVVPLLFAALLGPLAYALGRELDGRRLTALAMGVAGAVLPAGLLRHDLKQYTADAAVAVLLVWLGARAERLRTRRALVHLATACAVCCFVSHTTLLVAAAVFGGLLLDALLRRDARFATATTVAGVAAAAWMGAVYLAFARHGETPALTAYWQDFYVPSHGTAAFVAERAGSMLKLVGTGPWYIALVLVPVGVIALWRNGRRATALVLPVLTVVVLVAGAAHVYPLWERRTGLFYFALGTVVAAYAIGRAAAAVHERVPYASVLPLAAGALLLANTAVPNARSQVPFEDMPRWVRDLHAKAGPADTILVDESAAYAFAFYWHADRATFVRDDQRAVGFVPTYGATSRVHVVTPTTVAAAIDVAPPARNVWIVLTHSTLRDQQRYVAAASGRAALTTTAGGASALLIEIGPRT